MLISEIKFNASECAKFLNVCEKSVQTWCSNGALIARKDPHTSTWIIKGRNLATFLYYNPRYQHYLRTRYLVGAMAEKQKIILANVDSRPFLYHLPLLCDIFNVNPDTVKYWIKRERIKPLKRRGVYGADLFTEEAVQDFLAHTSTSYYQQRFKMFKEGEHESVSNLYPD